jgi:hypothetical protein
VERRGQGGVLLLERADDEIVEFKTRKRFGRWRIWMLVGRRREQRNTDGYLPEINNLRT